MNMKESKSISLAPYITGFLLAIVLTLLSYALVISHILSTGVLIGTVMSLAVVQLVVQLVFFLHFGRGKEARWNITAFFFMLLILLVIVVGSLWIMNNMNYNMLTTEQMNTYMDDNSGGF